MSMTSIAALAACALFAAAMVHVIVTDLRYRRIRNWLVAGLAAAYLPLALLSGVPGAEIALGFAAALLVFGAGFGSFAAGWVGGGDVKLASVAALWLGAEQTLPFLLLSSIFGAIIAIAMLASETLARRPAGAGTADAPRKARLMPYGPALALAGLMLLRESAWVDAL